MSSAKSGYQQALVATGTPVLSPYVPETGPYHASSGPYAPPQSPAMQTFGVRSAYTKEVVLLLLAGEPESPRARPVPPLTWTRTREID